MSRDIFHALVLWEKSAQAWDIRNRNRRMSPDLGINSIRTFRPGLLTTEVLPIVRAKELWPDQQIKKGEGGDPEIILFGHNTKDWECGFSYKYKHDKVFYCHLIEPERAMNLLSEASERFVLISPIGGIAPCEPYFDDGRVNFLLRWGVTGDIIRNLCYRLCYPTDNVKPTSAWMYVTSLVEELFNVNLMPPVYVIERGELILSYKENKRLYDISTADRSLHQFLLVLALIHLYPSSVWLMDEPFVYLDIDQQKYLYNTILNLTDKFNTQFLIRTNNINLYNKEIYQINNILYNYSH